MENKNNLEDDLRKLEEEHNDLDQIIHKLYDHKTINLMQIQRLKKKKLHLKDRILKIKDELEPDIIA
tara:strand:+ start:2131 stop:2331 length:201 start_codon:yes stop_codon:yes gene_type:complete